MLQIYLRTDLSTGRHATIQFHVQVVLALLQKDSVGTTDSNTYTAMLPIHTNPLKGRGVNWLHFAIQV